MDELHGNTLMDIAIDMAQEIQDTIDDIEKANGEPLEQNHNLKFLLERWESFYQRMNAGNYQVVLVRRP